MNCIKVIAGVLLISVLSSPALQSQHLTEQQPAAPTLHDAPDGHPLKHHRVSLLMYHNYNNVETSEGTRLLIIPALGLDYEYWINEKWGAGLHNDLVLTHKVKDNLLSDRMLPFLTTIDGLWKPFKGLVILAGPGIEFEGEEHLFFWRAGLEYEIEMGGHWDVCPTIFYDNRSDAFNTSSIGLGIGKRF